MQIAEDIGEFGLGVTRGTGLASVTGNLSSMGLASFTDELSLVSLLSSMQLVSCGCKFHALLVPLTGLFIKFIILIRIKHVSNFGNFVKI